MKKFRIFAMALSAVILLSAFCGSTASASSLRASPTLHSYNAIATQSSSTGKIVITYDVTANTIADSIGVSNIKIYKSNGSYVTTIYATSSNNLKGSNTVRHRTSYTYTGTSGTYYYAQVTVFATIDGVTDSRTITTNTVKAP